MYLQLEMKNWKRNCLVAGSVLSTAFLPHTAKAQSFLNQEITPAPLAAPTVGKMIVSVIFGPDGKVRACEILRSNAPHAVEATTLDYIRGSWGGPFFADSTETVQLIFNGTPQPDAWESEMANPPNLFPFDGKIYNLTLRISFGEDGWITDCKVLKPSGVEVADAETVAWLKAHWHAGAYVNKVVDAPFIFTRESATKSTVTKAKPKIAPQPEPAAVPAMRAK